MSHESKERSGDALRGTPDLHPLAQTYTYVLYTFFRLLVKSIFVRQNFYKNLVQTATA